MLCRKNQFFEQLELGYQFFLISVGSSVPYKHEKVQKFFLAFLRSPVFLSPAKNWCVYFAPKTVDSFDSWRHAYLCCTKPIENLQNSE